MVESRTATALAGVAASLVVSVLLYVYTGWALFFLFVPFVPFLFTRRSGDGTDGVPSGREAPPAKACPACDFRTRSPEFDYCPRDGRRLVERPER